jgi:hypothetical protein
MDECTRGRRVWKKEYDRVITKGKETRGGTALTYQIRGRYKYLR